MTSERSTAYGRVMRTLAELGPAKLHDAEAAIVRDAADTLLFAVLPQDPAAIEAITLVERLMLDLVEVERWAPESAQRLADDVAACGPALAVA
ncbi:MAG: hypothetical protein ACR2NB_12530 [Solirubrobacteraceae bacterium]